jgi:nucleoside-diphosphate-sugar epimerase
MKILVTGGTGFTGSHLVKRLLNKGNEVIVLDSQKGLFYNELAEKGAKIIISSVTDKKLVESIVTGCEVVYHLAAAFRKINLPKKVYWDINVEGTRNIIDAAFKNSVRKFVYCSTQGVHGDIKNPPGDESTPIAPVDYYQYTKYEGEKVVHEFIEKGMDATIIRPMAIYGPGDPGRFLLIYRMVKTGRFLMFGNGNTFYHPLYIDNLIDAFELSVEKSQSRGETYLIGDERYYTIEELVLKVGESMGVKVKIYHLPFFPIWIAALICEGICMPLRISPPIFRRRIDWYRQVRAFSIEKAKRELGYIPKVGIEEGLASTAKWYKDNGYI